MNETVLGGATQRLLKIAPTKTKSLLRFILNVLMTDDAYYLETPRFVRDAKTIQRRKP